MSQNDESTAFEKTHAASGCRNILQVGGICFALCIIIQFIYVQTLQFDFVNYDDNIYVYENDHLKHGLTKSSLEWAFTGTYASNWHPLTWISHLLDVERYGLQRPGGHHLTNVLIHTAAAIVLLLALWRLTGSLLPSAFAAAVFAIHPLRVESVAWISERKDVLSGLFFALTLLAYASYARRPSPHRYAHVVLAFVLGLLSKPMLVTVPFVLLLLDYWPLGRLVSKSRRRLVGAPSLGWLLAEKAPLLALAAAASVITIFAQDIAIRPMDKIPFSARIANAAVSYLAYIRQMFWPSDLAVIYKHPLDSLPGWQVIGACLILTGATIGAIAVRRRWPYLLVGWLWYLGMLIPVIGLVQVGYQARADRYTYLPQIGLIIALTWWVADLTARLRFPRPILVVTAVSVIAVLAWCAQRQTRYWRDGVSLFTRAVNCTDGNDIAHNNLGIALEKFGRYDEAAGHFREAVKLNPRDALSCINLGHALGMLGRQQEAILYFQKALAVDPDNPHALHGSGIAYFQLGNYQAAVVDLRRCLKFEPSNIVAAIALGGALYRVGQIDEAEAVLQEVVARNPSYPDAYDFLGLVRSRQGRFEEAVALHRKAVDLGPKNATWRLHLGIALYRSNRLREAMAELREAVSLGPDDTNVLKAAAWVAATSQDSEVRSGTDAVEWSQRAAKLSKDRDAEILDGLAAAYAEAGRFPEAKATAQKALDLAHSKGDMQAEAKIRAHLDIYRSGKPLREPPSDR